MLFNSLDFLLFFPMAFIVFLILPARFRQIWLLICSYFFYMCWNPWCIVLIFFSTVVTFISGIALDRPADDGKRRLIVAGCLISNLAILFFFKYFNFALNTVNAIAGHKYEPLDIILPVGISFYTFQALGYTIDCYRRTVKPEKNFIRYALFVSFFPQLVAGPIERSGRLLGQIKNIESSSRRDYLDFKRLQNGFILMAWGMFLKLVIADRVSILVDNVYSNVNLYGTIGLTLAMLGFGLQIYCDFSSYSTIAIGAAKIFNISLMENFDAPYFATSITDFWRKWHISLSSWFRDYLYIPLGGSRKGKGRKLINQLIVFTCSGLWHGANWTFVFWGTIHGLAIVVENLLRPILHKVEEHFEVNKSTSGFMLVRAFFVTVFVDLAWVFFRADSFGQAFTFLRRLFTKRDFWHLFDGSIFNYGLDVNEMWILAFAVALLAIVDFIRARKRVTIDQWLMGEFAGFRIAFLIVVIMAAVVFGQYGPGFDSKQFIYFQF